MNKGVKIPKGTIWYCKTCGLPLYKMLKDAMSNDVVNFKEMFDINKKRKINEKDFAYCPKCNKLTLGNVTKNKLKEK